MYGNRKKFKRSHSMANMRKMMKHIERMEKKIASLRTLRPQLIEIQKDVTQIKRTVKSK